MNIILVLGIIVWFAIMLVGPIIVYLNTPKPFSNLQKIGMLVSLVALLSVFVLPVLTFGTLSLNFADTLKMMGDQSDKSVVVLCSYYVPIFLTMYVFAPIICATLYMGNVGKKVAGILLIVSPLYLSILSNFSDFLKDTGLGAGSIIYLLCGIALLALPWFIKNENNQAISKKSLTYIAIGLVAIVGFIPAIWIQYAVHQKEEQKIEQKEKIADVEVVEAEQAEESNEITDIEEEEGGNAMPSVSPNDCFVHGIRNIAKYNPHISPSGDYSQAVSPGIYMYSSKKSFFIRAGKQKGAFGLKLNGEKVKDLNLDLGDLSDVIDIDGSCEYFFGQSDINGDGSDELIVAGRTIQEGGNRICINVYNLAGEADSPVKSFYNKVIYNNVGKAIVEPKKGMNYGYVEIFESETMKHKVRWYLLDSGEWEKIEE